MEITLRNIPDLPPEAAGFEVLEELTRPALGDYGLSTRTTWEPVVDDRWGLAIVARKPKPRGLAFIETLEPGTVFVHEGALYWRGYVTMRLLSPGNSDVVAASVGGGSWEWFVCTIPIDFATDNCRIIWPEHKEQDQ